MANKPEKFGLKFRMAVDVETKYLFNGFPYLEKDKSRFDVVSLPTNVVVKLMSPLFGKATTSLVTTILRHWIFRYALFRRDAV